MLTIMSRVSPEKKSRAQWQSDADLHAANYEELDCSIDADGHVFGLTKKKDGYIEPEPKGETKTLEQVLGSVKAHTAQTSACCVAKLYAPTIKAALEMVKAIAEAEEKTLPKVSITP